ncbi:MAG: hypothetical protein IJ124_08585 [Clostridia bacterium]|nr:hypothetical protein [Clostridia bacterium]
MKFNYIKKRHNRFSQPPRLVPAGGVDVSGGGRWRIWAGAGTKIDAPILGNGDLISAFAGPPRWPQFWLTTNDFWQMQSNPNYVFFHDNAVARRDPPVSLGSPRPLGRIVFDIPCFEGASYEAWQSFEDAVTHARFALADGRALTLEAWVAAGENELIVSFDSDVACDIGFEFRFPNEPGRGCDDGVDCMGDCEDDEVLAGTYKGLAGAAPLQVRNEKDGLLWGWRAFTDAVDVPTKLGFAARFIGADSTRIHLEAGERATLVCAVRSWDKTARPVEYARSRARWITEADIAALREAHVSWWRDFWGVSGIWVKDEALMNAYCLSQYMLASLSRDADYPPNILGISTYDRMAWNGNYKINYNHQSPYLGLLASGHFEQADPHDAPYLAMLDVGREMSLRLLGHPGVYLPLGLGPKGMVSEALLLHMKSPAVHGALNMLLRWRLSMDKDYLRRVYPFLRAVAEFWEHDLVDRDGVLHVVGDGMHERTTRDVEQHGQPEDPANTLGYLRSFFGDMLDASAQLGLDADRRERWSDILRRLAPYPVGTIDAIGENPTLWNEGERSIGDLLPPELRRVPVYLNETVGGSWSLSFPGNIMHIYPGGAIGLDSPPEALETARNTVAALSEMERALAGAGDDEGAQVRPAGAWNATNLGCLFFPAAVRVGFDPEIILDRLRDKLARTGLPNGFVDGNPHGIENLSTVPNTLQEMLLLSHQGTLRVFCVWPRRSLPDAAFFGLRARGGFVVSARLADGEVVRVEIASPCGGALRLKNPWPGRDMCVNGKRVPGEYLERQTERGDAFTVEPAQ